MSQTSSAQRYSWLAGSQAVAAYDAGSSRKRDRLVSLMLQDRRSVRLLSAPCGYGKTTLASEYAHRLFTGDAVAWVDGSSPEFLGGLDEKNLPTLGDELPALVVFEDVVFLDEERAIVFESLIEMLLEANIEVLVTTLPSNDRLRHSQSDRVLLTACDLLVTERDIRMDSAGLSEQEIAARIEGWRSSGEVLFGCAPCSVWSPNSSSEAYLTAFFEEKLPLSLLHAAFAMLLLGKGTFAHLARLGVEVRAEDIAMIATDYPFLGADPIQGEFSIGDLNLGELQRAVLMSGYGEHLLRNDQDMCQTCVSVLLDNDNVERAIKLADTFFSDAQCERWVERNGWSLLDRGEANLLETLVARCGDHALRKNPMLQAIQSWVCGMQGDARESLYYAKSAMGMFGEWSAEADGCAAYALSYLAFLAFRSDEPIEFQKPLGAVTCHTPIDCVAAMVCCCTEVEMEKGLGLFRGQHAVRNAFLGEEPEQMEKGREREIENLLIRCDRLFQGTTAHRLLLHFASCLNSAPLKEAAQEYGCGVMIGMRKRGARAFTEAVLITDLWRGGFFGATARGDDIRDGRLLDGASALLGKLARMCGKGPCAIPWESSSPAPSTESADGKQRKRGRGGIKKSDRLPVAKVTMFGGMEVLIGERYIPESYWNHRAMQLFSVLVLHQGRDVSRDTLFALIWPGLSRSRARDNFYTAWSHMQALLGEGPYLIRRGEFCSISSRYVSSDVSEFNQLARRLLTERDNTSVILDIYARMETLYRGGLLPGESGCEFIDQQRDKYRSIYVDGMVAAAHKSLDARDARIALWFARRAMDEDDKREDVYYALIKAQIAAGQRCSAIRTYFQCRRFLSDELGLDPSTKTEALYEQLLMSDPTLAKLKPESFR